MLAEKNISKTDNLQSSKQIAITVIVPVYNCEEYLEDAVASVLSQPYQDISVVLIDDGSTDDSGQQCDRLAAASNRVIVRHQENAGVSAARNAGIEFVLENSDSNAGKQYLAFLDADDCWTDDFFDTDTEQLLQKGYDLVGFQSCNCDAHLCPCEPPCEMKSGLHSGGQHSVWLHAKQSFAAMFYSCELILKYGIDFFEELKYSEDKIFSMQCMYLADTVYLKNRLLYLYRQTGYSAMHHRQYGIPYYVPIIDGYIKLDSWMRRFPGDNGLLSESRLMASIYIMDMIDEHYNVAGSKRKMDRLLQSRPDYISIVEATGKYADLTPSSSYAQYKAHPIRYMIHARLNGGRKLCKKICQKLVLIRK